VPTDADYTIADLARLTGLNVRTLRYWISQGLIPSSGESGPGAHYGGGHLDRVRLIKRLQAEYLPNAEIRRRLSDLSDAEVASLLGDEADQAAPREPSSALEYIQGILGAPVAAAGSARHGRTPALLRSLAPSALAETPMSPPSSMPVVGHVAQLSEAAVPVGPMGEEPSTTPERSQWERISLGPDIELHVRRPLSRLEQRRVERLITIARQVLNEDQS
jgi:DNA-binding transcriptional MerR regulator